MAIVSTNDTTFTSDIQDTEAEIATLQDRAQVILAQLTEANCMSDEAFKAATEELAEIGNHLQAFGLSVIDLAEMDMQEEIAFARYGF